MSTFLFGFGYHGPDGWKAVRVDPEFDSESTGVLLIEAESAADARDWGMAVARWYTRAIHPQDSNYSWSPDEYAVWVEEPQQSDEPTAGLLLVTQGAYPDLKAMRESLRD